MTSVLKLILNQNKILLSPNWRKACDLSLCGEAQTWILLAQENYYLEFKIYPQALEAMVNASIT